MVSIGVVALGAAAIQNCNAQGDGKAWTISAALRGFYDDNVNTSGGSGTAIDTFGFEVSPSLAYELPLDQTYLSLAYTFSYKYYEESPRAGTGDHDDMTHTIAAKLVHALSESTSVKLRDSFVIGQEPDTLQNGFSADSPLRISGDNIRNHGAISLSHQFTPVIGVQVGYKNSLFDYDDETALGYSAYLDRVEHHINLDGRWTLANNSVAILGYAFAAGCYTGDQPITDDGDAVTTDELFSDSRNYNSHYVYGGLEHTFRPDLVGSVRLGARFSDYYNSPADESSTSPYAEASLRYTYARDSSVEFGLRHDQSASDRFSIMGTSITTDSDTTVVYGALTHAITPVLSGSLMGQFQNNNFNGGALDNETEQFFMLNAALRYQFTPNIAGTLSYNYDNLDSDQVNRGYDRNRVYLGAVFTY